MLTNEYTIPLKLSSFVFLAYCTNMFMGEHLLTHIFIIHPLIFMLFVEKLYHKCYNN